MNGGSARSSLRNASGEGQQADHRSAVHVAAKSSLRKASEEAGPADAGLWDVSAADYCVEALLESALASVPWGGLFLRESGEKNGGNVTWDRVIVSGHSQGAGHAAFWAQSRPVLGAGSSWSWAVAMHPVILPPPLGVHNGHVPGSQGAPRGSGAPHGPPRRSATLTQMEPVRVPTWGGTARGAKTRPITASTLGAHVVGVLGPLVRWWPPRGVASSGKPQLNRSLCAPRVLRESGGAFRAAGRRPICTREAGTRFRHFMARHRTFPCSVRCLRGTCRRGLYG